jgi:hypothetical protein
MIHKLTHALALATATGAVAAPAASAMLPPAEPVPVTTAGYTPPPTVRSVESGGFSYDDAAIGAGAVLALLVAGSGGTLVLRRIRRPHVSPTAHA